MICSFQISFSMSVCLSDFFTAIISSPLSHFSSEFRNVSLTSAFLCQSVSVLLSLLSIRFLFLTLFSPFSFCLCLFISECRNIYSSSLYLFLSLISFYYLIRRFCFLFLMAYHPLWVIYCQIFRYRRAIEGFGRSCLSKKYKCERGRNNNKSSNLHTTMSQYSKWVTISSYYSPLNMLYIDLRPGRAVKIGNAPV